MCNNAIPFKSIGVNKKYIMLTKAIFIFMKYKKTVILLNFEKIKIVL